MATIIVDKSFLQGIKALHVRALAAEHRLLMSDALLYELLTTSATARRRCFSKFPTGRNPVDLISHTGKLMRLEIDTHKAAGLPSTHKDSITFQFNDRLVEADYVPPSDALQAIEDETARIKGAVHSFLDKIEHIPSFFPSLLKGTSAEQKRAHQEAEEALASPRALFPFISQLTPPPGEKPLPPVESMTEQWAIYRWIQVQLLFALDVYVRYQGNPPEALSQSVFERMEHDVLDAELLMLGVMEGAFATYENKLKRWFSLIRPDGDLYE